MKLIRTAAVLSLLILISCSIPSYSLVQVVDFSRGDSFTLNSDTRTRIYRIVLSPGSAIDDEESLPAFARSIVAVRVADGIDMSTLHIELQSERTIVYGGEPSGANFHAFCDASTIAEESVDDCELFLYLHLNTETGEIKGEFDVFSSLAYRSARGMLRVPIETIHVQIKEV